jgi:hypothetical protein
MALGGLAGRILLLSAFAQLAAQRRGGHDGGDRHDIDTGNDKVDGEENGNNDSDGLETPTYECGVDCACIMDRERDRQTDLPGLYYNGTLTVTHHLTDNSAWALERPEQSDLYQCHNNDRAIKEYEYPSIFFVGPTGNESDTNPIFWILRGYQPANQTQYSDDAYLDVWQRWIHLRSSDFQVTNGTKRYQEADIASLGQEEGRTRVYWSTNITDVGNNTFSARAVYEEEPVLRDVDVNTDEELSSGIVRTSQYVTLSDVCIFRQGLSESAPGLAPPSLITEASPEYEGDVTAPTIWLPKGITAEMEGIGASSLSFRLRNTSFGLVTPLVSQEFSSCWPDVREHFEASDFYPLYSILKDAAVWNLTGSLSLTFQGRLVPDITTYINGTEDGKPIFEKTYEREWDFWDRVRHAADNDSSAKKGASWLQGDIVIVIALITAIVVFY